MEFKQTKLSNGLTIIAEINPAAASVAAGFFAKTGSRDETAAISGVSHFLEHMMFKGTARRSPFDVNREFDEMGANYNAFTSEENTVYYASVLPEFQHGIVDLLGDMLRPSLRQEDFDMEKNVILEEIALYEDRPRFRTYDKLMAEFFAGHPLGQSILGSCDSIKALTRDQMQEYFDRRYSPNNLTVVGVGKLNFDAFVADVAKLCSHWTPADAPRVTPAPSPAKKSICIVDSKLTRQQIGMMSPAPANQDEDRYASALAATIIGDTTGSRFYYALVEPAIADEASMEYNPMDHAGGFITFISADPDNTARAVEISRKTIAEFIASGPTETELTGAKNKLASAATLGGELPMGRMTAVGFDWVYRNEYRPLAENIEKMMAVTSEKVVEVARRYDLSQLTTVCLGPKECKI